MAGRYQLRAVKAERGGVTTHEGVDPLTGLPVLVYRFAGQPAQGLRDLESENIPGLLHIDSEDGKTEVVTAYFKEYAPVGKPLTVAATTLLLDGARALKDAAQMGVVHGDIGPGRFLASRDHVLLEGFGIPWRASENPYYPPDQEATFTSDVYAFAKSVLELAEGALDGATLSLLTSCLVADARERPAASELYSALKPAPTPSQSAPPQSAPSQSAPPQPAPLAFADAELTFAMDVPEDIPTEPVFDFAEGASFGDDFGAPTEKVDKKSDEKPLEPFTEPAAAPAQLSNRDAVEQPPTTEPEGGGWDARWEEESGADLLLSDPGERYLQSTAAPPQTEPKAAPEPFVKNLPPGATYRPGEANTGLRPGAVQEYSFNVKEPPNARRRRLIIMLAALFVGAALLAYLALFWQQRQSAATPPAAQSAATGYIVEATIGPSDLPPVDLYVVISPPGSRNPPGALVSRLSPPGRQVALDKAGTWQLQARFEKRASNIVTFQVPQDRRISFTLPPEAVDTAPQP